MKGLLLKKIHLCDPNKKTQEDFKIEIVNIERYLGKKNLFFYITVVNIQRDMTYTEMTLCHKKQFLFLNLILSFNCITTEPS